MQEVEIKPLPLERLASILTPERAQRLFECAARARASFGDCTIWHVNATARGGGVAEMLQTLLAYGRGAQIDNRWLVLDGEPEFFVGGETLRLGAGSFVAAPLGAVHTFSNPGPDRARLLNIHAPSVGFHEWLRTVS